MRFLLRSLLVLAIATIFGIVLYYAVQALPGARSNSPRVILPAEKDRNRSLDSALRQIRPKGQRNGGIRWRPLLQIPRRVLTFSILVLISILGKNLVFGRRPGRKDPRD